MCKYANNAFPCAPNIEFGSTGVARPIVYPYLSDSYFVACHGWNKEEKERSSLERAITIYADLGLTMELEDVVQQLCTYLKECGQHTELTQNPRLKRQ